MCTPPRFAVSVALRWPPRAVRVRALLVNAARCVVSLRMCPSATLRLHDHINSHVDGLRHGEDACRFARFCRCHSLALQILRLPSRTWLCIRRRRCFSVPNSTVVTSVQNRSANRAVCRIWCRLFTRGVPSTRVRAAFLVAAVPTCFLATA